MKKDFAQSLVKKTIADYNRISLLWSTKRWRTPSDMFEVSKIIKSNDQILDLGCGNGIFYEAVKDLNVEYTGADASEELIKICKEKYPDANFITTEPFILPFPNNSFDKVFCLSVMHHIPSDDLRLVFLKEIKRVLKAGGTLVLSAWNIEGEMCRWWQENKEKYPDSADFDEGDIYYPIKNSDGQKAADRYIHCFQEEELRNILNQSGFEVEKIKIIARGKGNFQNLVSYSRNAK